MDDADERIGLREIAPQLAAREIEIFGQQARRGAVREHLFEQLARLVAPPAQVQRLDQPEGADIEGGLGQAEIILAVVSQHMLAATQRLFDRGEGRLETRIIGADIAQLDHLEQAGVEVGVAEGGAIMARRLVPGLALDRFADLRRAAIPMRFAIGLADARRDVAEPRSEEHTSELPSLMRT